MGGMLDDQSIDLADEVGKVAAEAGVTHTAVALAWVLSRRGVTSVIIRPRTFEQHQQNWKVSTSNSNRSRKAGSATLRLAR